MECRERRQATEHRERRQATERRERRQATEHRERRQATGRRECRECRQATEHRGRRQATERRERRQAMERREHRRATEQREHRRATEQREHRQATERRERRRATEQRERSSNRIRPRSRSIIRWRRSGRQHIFGRIIMLKTMKYELIRNKTVLIVLASIMGGSELIFLLGYMTKRAQTLALGMVLLTFGAMVVYFTIWLLGLISFGRDLREKSGYMVFLTPVSPYKIICAKMLVGLVELMITAFLLIVLASLDLNILASEYRGQISIIRMFAQEFGTTVDNVWGVFIVLIIITMIEVLTLYSIAYLAAALAAMMSRTGGSQKWISIGLVLVILIVFYTVSNSLPKIDSHASGIVMRELLSRIPQVIFAILMTIGCTIGTGYLVEKKVSL